MMLEFYKHGGRVPENFEIFMHDDGRMSFDHRRATKGYIRVIVGLKGVRPNGYQANAMFQLISKLRSTRLPSTTSKPDVSRNLGCHRIVRYEQEPEYDQRTADRTGRRR